MLIDYVEQSDGVADEQHAVHEPEYSKDEWLQEVKILIERLAESSRHVYVIVTHVSC